jgi:hypothetical protein
LQQHGEVIMTAKHNDDQYSAQETARRRDEVIRHMADTPPQPKASPRQKNKKTTAVGRAVRKARVVRGA